MTERVTRLAARGDGVTESGRYVAGAVPGDIVEGEAVIAGPHRALPPCVHFATCGGCQLQHADEFVLGEFVVGRILAALKTVGIEPHHIHPVHLSPPRSRRRASLRAVRKGGNFYFGFNVEASSAVVDLAECHVLTPALFHLVQRLRPLLPAIVGRSGAVGIMATETHSGFDVALTGDAIDRKAIPDLVAVASAAGIARMAGDEGVIVQLSEPIVRFDGIDVAFPPGAFLQATVDAQGALQAAIGDCARGATRIADLFCGLGTFALPLSQRAEVLAADAAGPAIAALQSAARRTGRRVRTEHRDLFRRPLAAKELARFDLVVLDPPRAGALAQIGEIAVSKLDRIAYVSCNPNTFARDAKVLHETGFKLERLWPVGQFRWSTHVELAGLFVR